MYNEYGYDNLFGKTVRSFNGEKVGDVGSIYLDDVSHEISWVTVNTGLFGTKETFVPITSAAQIGDEIQVPYTKDQIKGAPNIDADAHISKSEEQHLYNYYNLNYTPDSVDETATTTTAAAAAAAGTYAPRDAEVVRSEEQLIVGKEAKEIGKARLKKYVVTEHVNVRVPVAHEEVRVVREPATGYEDTTLEETEREVTLRGEYPTVEKRTVPVEKVRLETEEVIGTEPVSEKIQKERVEVEGVEEENRGYPYP